MEKTMRIIAVCGITVGAMLLACLLCMGVVVLVEMAWHSFTLWFNTGLNGVVMVMCAFVVALIGGMALNLKPSKR